MKRNILLIALLCLSFRAKAQSGPQPIVLGHIDTVYSEILKEKRPVWVYTPSFDTSYFTKPAYPVLYVLDGDGYFTSLVTMIQQLSAVNGNTVLPEMIIVGIPNTSGHRTRDLTPIASPSDKTSGGGENFTAFIEKELVPYIDKTYASAPYRTLMGHSLGGLLTINTLMKHTALFNAYVALEPSMFYDNDNLLGQTKAILQQKDFKGRTLFLGIANTMNPGMDTLQVRADTTIITHHIRSILKLKDNLQKHPANHLRWDYKYYPDDDHASMPMIAAYDALRFIFQDNRFPRNQPQNQFFDKSLNAAQLEKMIKEHYQLLSKEMGYDVKPQESNMNMFGYIFLQQKDYDRSGMFFKQNIDYYPGSFNAYDSMGDYYLAINNKSKAIEYFKKALSIKYRQEIKDKLDKVLKQ
ncbi:MAG TPA: alpha/beta hydrolase-fold protein [Mucilaginibacter sp.]|jgi:predicted alpha/beta superfamily hydrolase|nr:alpha/beta hydrolase-fold protein [Mucilaginibacter sp.]